jgi:hypothetical protein
MQELALGDEGFGAPERAHRLVYHVRENRWERMETQVPLNTHQLERTPYKSQPYAFIHT